MRGHTAMGLGARRPSNRGCSQLDGDGIRVLRVGRHGNKLRPGHLRGNRFRILIRDVPANAAELAAPILDTHPPRRAAELLRPAAVRP